MGIISFPIPDETVLLFIGYLSVKGDLSAPSSTVLYKEAHQCMNV